MNVPQTSSARLSVSVAAQTPTTEPHEAVAVCVFSDEPRLAAPPHGGDDAWRPLCAQLIADGEFKGEAGTSLLLHTAGTSDGERRTQRIMLVGLGEPADFDAAALRRAAGMAARKARAAQVRHLYFVMPEDGDAPARLARALAEGAQLGLYDGDL